MKILVKYHCPQCIIEQHGNWIDLKSAEDVEITNEDFDKSMFTPIGKEIGKDNTYIYKSISLGVYMDVPNNFEAYIIPKRYTFRDFGMLQGNSFIVIEGDHSWNKHVWEFPAIFLKPSIIRKGDRICQFSIRPSMNASWLDKLKWIFTKIQFVDVDSLSDTNRGGFGSSGI
jgi:dUTP pyrophosphatase